MRTAIVVTLLAAATLSACHGQEPSSRTELAAIESFVGTWKGEIGPPTSPPGTVVNVEVEEAGLGTFVSVIARFAPKGVVDGTPIIASITRINGKSNSLWTWFHGPYGHLQGATLVEGNRVSTKAEGFSQDGKTMSSVYVMEVDGETLTMSMTQTVVGDKQLPDQELRLSLVSRPQEDEGTTGSVLALLKELQGTWKLPRSNGGWNEKTVDGNSEVVTYYDADGNVDASHQVKFRVSELNGKKHFSILEMKFTAGPRKGTIVPKVFLQQSPGYDYEVTASTFTEIQARPDGSTRKLEWKRVSEEDK